MIAHFVRPSEGRLNVTCPFNSSFKKKYVRENLMGVFYIKNISAIKDINVYRLFEENI